MIYIVVTVGGVKLVNKLCQQGICITNIVNIVYVCINVFFVEDLNANNC